MRGVPKPSHGTSRGGRSLVHAGYRSPACSAQVSAMAASRQSMNGEPDRRGALAIAAAVNSGNRWSSSVNARSKVQSGCWSPLRSTDHALVRSARRIIAMGSGFAIVSVCPSARKRRVRVSQRGSSCPRSIRETVGYATSASRANSRVEMPSDARAWRIHTPGVATAVVCFFIVLAKTLTAIVDLRR